MVHRLVNFPKALICSTPISLNKHKHIEVGSPTSSPCSQQSQSHSQYVRYVLSICYSWDSMMYFLLHLTSLSCFQRFFFKLILQFLLFLRPRLFTLLGVGFPNIEAAFTKLTNVVNRHTQILHVSQDIPHPRRLRFSSPSLLCRHGKALFQTIFTIA